tara:strand:- start:167 stop:331 length:165 start_codon:yes stop_codon:yes gene_type:complete
VDAVVEASGEVNAKEREPWVRDRVHQPPDQIGRWADHVEVLAAEGQNASFWSFA